MDSILILDELEKSPARDSIRCSLQTARNKKKSIYHDCYEVLKSKDKGKNYCQLYSYVLNVTKLKEKINKEGKYGMFAETLRKIESLERERDDKRLQQESSIS